MCKYSITPKEDPPEGEPDAELVTIIENKKGGSSAHIKLLAACDSNHQIRFSAERSLLPQKSKSSGYGSTIVHRCATFMGGESYLEVNETTTKFVLKIPVFIAASVDKEAEQQQESDENTSPDVHVPVEVLSGLRFGLVDDQKLIAKVFIAQVNQLMGASCIWLEPEGTVPEMVQHIVSAKVDILFVDHQLGDFGHGPDLIKKLASPLCDFNGLAIAYTGSEGESDQKWPLIQKSTRGMELVQQVQQAWAAFIQSKSLRSKHVLLVDDTDLHCYLETKLLNKERATITRFRDGIELVEHVEQIMQSHKGSEDTISWPWHAGSGTGLGLALFFLTISSVHSCVS